MSVRPIVQVEDLVRTFKIWRRDPGLRGALRTLFSREHTIVRAVDGIRFDVAEGELVGFIGANGAGKSTTIKILTGILHPTSGRAVVDGLVPYLDRRANAAKIGVVFGQKSQLWWDLPLVESFRVLRWVYGVPRADHEARLTLLIEVLELQPFLMTPVRKLSLGQRVRGDLAASLLHEPRLLFLDEPTIGLDVDVRDRILDFIRETNRVRGTTVLFTTHDLLHLERICRRIIVIDRGRILFDGPLERLKGLFGSIRRASVQFEGAVDLGEVDPGVRVLGREGNSIHLEFDPTRIPVAGLVANLESRGRILDLAVTEPSIEEVVKRLFRGDRQ